jgi:3-oxoacyl-[acyl-carrier-protein] synthase-3
MEDDMTNAGITATGVFFPEQVVGNDYFAKKLDTNDEWILSRTGIAQRHFVTPGTGSSDLALEAAKSCLQQRGMDPEEIELIVFATVTPDTMFPASACRLQHALGCTRAWGFDLSGACSGFLYALSVANSFVSSGRYEKVLVVGADVMTSIINPEDRTTAVLFGDGAGCVLLEPVNEGGYLGEYLRIDGGGAEYLFMPAGGSRRPASLETVQQGEHFVHQFGREVFKRAVTEMAAASKTLLDQQGVSIEEVKLFVPHQANKRIIDSVANRLGLREEQIMINIDRRGNTTAATLPSCLHEAHATGRIEKGDLVLLGTFGAGFTWGAGLLRWSY